ncbi:hypothetical protein SEA_PHTOWN_96 [Streptomyces phage PHTowN]|nr:hypothetical protein SEA_PHTOWN_96 [Streptomyces phage PHTowN]
MSYSIRYNRATNHIAGIACKTTSNQTDEDINRTGVVAYYAENACGVLTRGRLAQGASYDSLEEALKAARITGGRKVCKTCEKAALAALEAEAEAAANAPVEESEPEVVEGAEHQVGDKLYFIPLERPHGYACPAGEVEVVRVIDHGEPTLYSPRFTYVVQVPGVPASSQGTDHRELHKIGEVPVDYRFEWTYLTAICSDCRQNVTFANSKIVEEPILREGPVYPGMATVKAKRVCAHH